MALTSQKAKKPGVEETEDKHVEVLFSKDIEAKQIILPDGMDCTQAIKWLTRKDEEMNRKVAVRETVDAYPLDGAYALHRAMAEKYGWTNLIPTPNFFGETPPMMIGVVTGTGPGDVVQVPWGRMQIPGVVGYIETSLTISDNRPKFIIGGQVTRKHEQEVAELAKRARQIVAASSIYRKKALRMKFIKNLEEVQDINDFNPRFMDVSGVKEDELIFPGDTAAMIKTNLFTPIEFSDVCREHRIPLKRGVLLAGPYGVGKTLTAYVTAKKCVENGWTFIYLDSVGDLAQAIHFAKQYGPAVIFAEDIDQVVNVGTKRDEAINAILNTIDGVDTKSSEIIVALTTNHVDQVSQAMLRPGRLDAVVHIPPPDSDAAQRLVRLYSRSLLADGADLSEVGKELNGRIPAVIREVVERAKLGAISHTAKGEKTLQIHSHDLLIAARTMTQHLELLKPKDVDMRSDVEKAAAVTAGAISQIATTVSKLALPSTYTNGSQSAGAQSQV